MLLVIDNHPFHYEMESLLGMFCFPDKVQTIHACALDGDGVFTSMQATPAQTVLFVKACLNGRQAQQQAVLPPNAAKNVCERKMGVLLYQVMEHLTGICLPWGVLTGIRPVKYIRTLLQNGMPEDAVRRLLKDECLLSDSRIDLGLKTASEEARILSLSREDSFSLYVSIPFCPSRCHYCSFVSHAIDKAKKLMPEYVSLLCKELEATGRLARELGLHLETVYFGGGTPTTLTAPQLDSVCTAVADNFDFSGIREYTVEAGRPDTIDKEKLNVLHKHGVSRISINPQTLNDQVLENIGRRHTAQQVIDSFYLARECGFDNINMDLIAGLQGDTPESFFATLDKVLALSPENVTVHTLSLKRAADLAQERQQMKADIEQMESMLSYAHQRLPQSGYAPYYLYKQKNTLGNLENTGYAKPGFEGLYNVFIMDETHSILSTGAGGVTKLKQPGGSRIERVFNYKFPYEYISRFDEILKRKEQVRTFYAAYR